MFANVASSGDETADSNRDTEEPAYSINGEGQGDVVVACSGCYIRGSCCNYLSIVGMSIDGGGAYVAFNSWCWNVRVSPKGQSPRRAKHRCAIAST